jgi:hypothetical protein
MPRLRSLQLVLSVTSDSHPMFRQFWDQAFAKGPKGSIAIRQFMRDFIASSPQSVERIQFGPNDSHEDGARKIPLGLKKPCPQFVPNKHMFGI